MKNKDGQSGVALVGAVALMVFASFFATMSTNITATAGVAGANLVDGTQAFAITNAGVEWYLEQLQGDTNWTDETTQTKTFAGGQFQITINSATATEVNFTSTGTITSGFHGITVQRQMTLAAQKIPSAFQFALFNGTDPANFRIQSRSGRHSTITGDVWSFATVNVNANNTVTGTVYVPDAPPAPAETVTGSGTYTGVQIAPPHLDMPVIDTTPYDLELADFETLLTANTSTTNRTVSSGTFNIDASNPDCSGSPVVCEFRNFTTNGTVTITGDGTIVANRSINLHSSGVSASNTLTVTPDANGVINFIADRNVLVGSTSNPVITASSGVTYYSASTGATTRLLRVRGTNTSLTGNILYGGRRIIIDRGADVIGDSVIYIKQAASTSNNLLRINGGSGVTTIDGTLISLSQRDNGLQIINGGGNRTNVSFTGLAYARGDATLGGCQLQDATINGSVVCNRYLSNRVRNVGVTYGTEYFPSTLPNGFDGFIVKKQNSWDGV